MKILWASVCLLLPVVTLARQPLPPEPPEALSPELFEAIRSSDERSASALLDAQPRQIHARDATGATALILAALYADARLVELLLDRGAQPDATDSAGCTALHWAATDVSKARALLARGCDVNVRTAMGNTPLILAVRSPRSAPVARLLIERGADVHARNVFGVSALLVAAAAEDPETLRLLLERGADVGVTPYAQPLLAGADPIFGGGLTPLGWAAFRGDGSAVRTLLDRGASLDAGSLLGTPLLQAAQRGELEVARLLIERGASVDGREGPGEFPPLLWAAAAERPDAGLVELLLRNGASADSSAGAVIESFMENRESALMIARRRGDTPVVQALLKAGAREQSDPLATRNPVPSARVLPDSIGEDVITSAIARALPWLEESAVISYDDFSTTAQTCVSCHSQYFPLFALGAARKKGFARNETRVAQLAGVIRSDQKAQWSYYAEPTFNPAPAQIVGFAAMSLAEEGVEPGRADDVLLHGLAAFQAADGRWLNYLPRPPIQTSDVGPTAMAIRAMTLRTLPGRAAEFAERKERARRWLAGVEPYGIDERVFQLLGLFWAGTPPAALEGATAALLAEQRADGGWPQLPTLSSDPYATAQALYALHTASAVPRTHPAYERGIRYLLTTQLEDGTWFVRRRAYPFQPTFVAGFPHGRDAWISVSATSWAVAALTTTLESSGEEPRSATPRPQLVSADPAAITMSRLPVPAGRQVDFTLDIEPLLERSCAGCHSGSSPRSGYRVERHPEILAGGRSRKPAVIPGDSARSPIVRYAAGLVEDFEMPPPSRRASYPALTVEQIATLRAWIDQGARGPVPKPGLAR